VAHRSGGSMSLREHRNHVCHRTESLDRAYPTGWPAGEANKADGYAFRMLDGVYTYGTSGLAFLRDNDL
jgi:hypothetical protein